MPARPSASKAAEAFREQLAHRCTEAVRLLGADSAQIMAKAARDGALSSNRIVFSLMDALEAGWRALIDGAMSDARDFEIATKTKRVDLVEETKRQLMRVLPTMVTASKVDRSRSGFQNTAMLQSVSERIVELDPYLQMKLRQFRQKTGEPEKRKTDLHKFSRDLAVALLVAAAAWLLSEVLGS